MHFTKFDFLTLWVKEENRQRNIDWYVNHLGLTIGWDSPTEKLTLLKFPSNQAITLLAHYPEDANLQEGNVRVCLTTDDLLGTKQSLEQAGIQTTAIYQMPWQTDAFDFFDPQGTKLTATTSLIKSDFEQPHKFNSYFLYITVSDLSEAKQWYSTLLGMTPAGLPAADHYSIMRMPDDEQVLFPIFLSEHITTNSQKPSNEPIITAVRPFFQLTGKLQLEDTQASFKANHIKISEISGNSDDFMRWFDFADPNGNQLHAIAY